MAKLSAKITNPKHQIPNKLQIQNSKLKHYFNLSKNIIFRFRF